MLELLGDEAAEVDDVAFAVAGPAHGAEETNPAAFDRVLKPADLSLSRAVALELEARLEESLETCAHLLAVTPEGSRLWRSLPSW